MDNFKVVFSNNGTDNTDQSKLLRSIAMHITEELQNYIDKSIYNISIENTDLKDKTDIERLSIITNMIPNLLINLNMSNMMDNEFNISIYKNSQNVIQTNFANNLITRLLENSDYNVYNNCIYDTLYMNRQRYFPTVTININKSTLTHLLYNNCKEIAKSIFTAIVECFIIPEKGEVLKYETTANINLKAKPEKGSEYVVTVPKGTIVELLFKNNNVYWNISASVDGIIYTGYAIQMYLKPVKKD